jgi:hypothetical protein
VKLKVAHDLGVADAMLGRGLVALFYQLRQLVRERLLVESLLLRRGESLPTVLDRPGDAGEAAVGGRSLEALGHREQFLLAKAVDVARVVSGQPVPGFLRLDRGGPISASRC